MFLSACLLLWAWGFHLLSRLCFFLAGAYITITESIILEPLGYRPILLPKRDVLLQRQQHPAAQPAGVSDTQQLHSSMADLPQQMRHLQSCANSPRHNDENVQRWFQNHAAASEMAESDLSTLGISPPAAARHRGSAGGHLQSQPAACAAAAAAMALYGQSNISAGAKAAVIGAAALFAQRLSSSSDPESSCTQLSSYLQGNSSCCTVPPLEYDVSAEEQREIEDCAPPEFLCPLGRVLMTDPVCTPSGFTYQRSSIEEFLVKTGHDPARDTPLSMQQLYPNIVMRDQIATWLQKRGVAT